MGGVAAVSMVWVLFADFAVAPLIESAYRGESFAFLNHLIGGSGSHSLETYLEAWQDMSTRALGMLLVIGMLPLPL